MKTDILSVEYKDGRRISTEQTEFSKSEDCYMLSQYYNLLSGLYAKQESNVYSDEIKSEIEKTLFYIERYTKYLKGYEVDKVESTSKEI